ncbi:ribonuclease P/MRP protein subunit RPP1 [Nematocida displodere]|uniref:Ribonuclease P/MRP protein subunit RPP1 n=1 Tax=Nematocida displodere TaxID=1805483 RepID=A0A177EGK4_9MICR|nr:ribonuclease P/MRP protein subunit RPP1 [Nematocida displodere]
MEYFIETSTESPLSRPEEWDCIITRDTVNLAEKPAPKTPNLPRTKPSISKLAVVGVVETTNPREVYSKGGAYDLLEVVATSNEVLERCSMWKIDSVSLDLSTSILTLRKGTVAKAVNNHLYFTIDISPYYSSERRRNWIYNTKELLRLAKKTHINISVGKMSIPKAEIVDLFKKFKLKEKTIHKMLTTNPETMLIRAAVKKYAHQGSIAQVLSKEAPLKQMLYRCRTGLKNIKG